MRILHLGFCANPSNSLGCSHSNLESHWFQKMLKDMPDLRIVSYQPEGFKVERRWKHPRLEVREYVGKFMGQREETGHLPAEVIHDITRVNREYDIVLLARPRVFTVVRGLLLDNQLSMKDVVPIYVINSFLMEKAGRFADVSEFAEMSFTPGWVYADGTIFWNQQQFASAKRMVSKYLRGSLVEQMTQRFMPECCTGTLDIDTLEKIPLSKSKDTFRVSFAHRMAGYYDFGDTAELLRLMKMIGESSTFVITTPQVCGGITAGNFKKALKNDPYDVELHFGLPQWEYYDIAATCHAFVEKTTYSEACPGVLEQLFLGQIGIFSDKLFVIKEFLPEAYPFLYDTEQECFAMLKYVRAKYWTDEMQQLLQNVREHLYKTAGVSDSAAALSARMQEEYQKQLTLLKPGVLELAQDAVEYLGNPETITLSEYSQAVTKVAKGGVRLWTSGKIRVAMGAGGGFEHRHFLQAIQRCGYIDDATQVEPCFVKRP